MYLVEKLKEVHFSSFTGIINSSKLSELVQSGITTPRRVFRKFLYDVIRFLSVGYPPESIECGTPSRNALHKPRHHLGKFGALFHSVMICTLSDRTKPLKSLGT